MTGVERDRIGRRIASRTSRACGQARM